MAKEDFLKVLVGTPDAPVELKYPRLAETYRFNTAERRSEPCQPTANGASYSITWGMPADEAKALYGKLKAHYDARQAAGSVKAPFSTVFGMRKLEDGTVEFRAKRNGTKGSGEVNTPPLVIGGDKQPLADKNIWGGSKGMIRCWAAPVTDPDGKGGISLYFDAVQVTEVVYGGGGLDDFAEVAAPVANDPFAADAPADDPFAPAPAAATASTTLADDEIPW